MTTWLNVKNNAESALASAITAAATSLTLITGDGAKFPASNFHISIDDEILLCSSRTGDVLTVTRAQEGTVAAAHAVGAIVALNVTAGIITQLQEAVDLGGGEGGGGDMLKSIYDTDNDYIVDNAEKLEGSTKSEVQDHAPKAHKSSHENGGADEISLSGLDGEPSTLTTHKALATGVHGVGSGTVAKVTDIATDANLSTAAQDAISKKHSQLCEAADFTKLDGIEAGADVTANHDPKAHKSSHAVGGADSVFPADPNADKYLKWDDTAGALIWADAGEGGGGGGDMYKSTYDTDSDGRVDKAESVDDGTNSATAADIKDAVTKKHSLGSDTTLGTQTADLNMGGKAITNVGNVDGVDVSAHDTATQNVHGIGSDYICGAKSSGIKARDFVKGWTSGKVLKGAGVDVNPAELTFAEALTDLFSVALPENVGIILDAALSADGKYSGIVETGTAGTALSFGDLVYFSATDSKWELSDADAANTSKGKLGICVAAAAEDATTTILLYGKVRADTAFPALTIGAPVYVGSTPGDVEVTVPSKVTNKVVRIIGYGNSADELFFCPDNTYLEYA